MPSTAVTAAATSLTVADVMVTDVKTSRADATVGELRALFADEHVHAAVLIEDGLLLTVIERDDLAGHGNGAAAADLGRRHGRITTPDADLEQARQSLLTSGRRRLAVIDADGTLRGLLCFKRSRTGFCSDRDVHAREPHAPLG